MSQGYKINRIEYEIIKSHNLKMIEACKARMLAARQAKRYANTPYVRNQLAFDANVISGLKWSTAIARQAAGVPNDPAA